MTDQTPETTETEPIEKPHDAPKRPQLIITLPDIIDEAYLAQTTRWVHEQILMRQAIGDSDPSKRRLEIQMRCNELERFVLRPTLREF